MKAETYMHSVLWCCNSCGFLLEGGQPTMECPICEAYKSSFIDSPAHVEAAVRADHGDLFNGADARAQRLQLLKEGGYLRSFRLKGRSTSAVHDAQASRKHI